MGSESKANFGIYFIMLLVPLFWGGAFGSTKHVLTELPPLTASAVRFLIAGLLMALWVVVRKDWDWAIVKHNWLGLLGLGLTGVFGYNVFFAMGLQYTSAINGALVIVINPVTTALISVLFLGEAWSLRLGLGVGLSLAGVLTVITKGNFGVLANMSFNYGEILLLGAVASWTAYTTLGKMVMRNIGAVPATAVSTLMGAILLIISSFMENAWRNMPNLSFQVVAELLYLAVFSTVVAFILFNIGIRRLGASKASAYINLMPVNALLIAAAVYGETVTIMHIIGMVLVISGVLLTTTASGAKPVLSKQELTCRS
ncbi:MAG TPA: DMT family transporter [Methylomusa anaerophila]|uniref:Putative inner membrane transporter YhbE n=1 Tax=Methylomusa anaerophila TaxID=1930071 RepID=A0A348ANQ5_9FIRM|nr:DMT family transporter [Methylomusa anaerophila]BBB92703.1 putative inner membrane transporter YhbE [Methylomusa anaerophila]HML87444.1 DMT family transporter [Methylomusa anaerophila]